MADDIAIGQTGFDGLGPHVHTAEVRPGRAVRYIDVGEPSWRPVVFFGGAGTTVRAFRLLEFARTLREQLQVRMISVERNGLGRSVFRPDEGYREYADDVWSVLDALDVPQTSLIAISGGGPYLAHVAVRHPDRVRSLHLACAYSEPIEGALISVDVDAIIRDPMSWWTYPRENPLHGIPGFTETVVEEATSEVYGVSVDRGAGLRRALALGATEPLPDLREVTAPVFLYWGRDDAVVPLDHQRRWAAALPGVRLVRLYDGEQHDVQYRHWDQILVDLRHLGERVLVTLDGQGRLVPQSVADAEVAAGRATLGLPAWAAREQGC